MKCRSGQPSLESVWGLHAITIPAASLGLSLIPDSDVQNPLTSKKAEISGSSWLMLEGGGCGGGVGGCGGGEDVYRVNTEARSRQNSACNSESTTSTLPSWLQQYKDENSKRASNLNNDQDSVPVKDLCKRWSSICTPSSTPISPSPSSSTSPTFERTLSFSSISPSSSTSNFSYDHLYLKLQPTHHQSFEPKNFWASESTTPNKSHLHHHHEKPTFTMYIQEQRHANNNMFVSSSNPNSTPTSTSSSDVMDQMESQGATPRFKDYNADNLRLLCNALEQKVPRQKDIIIDIASTILHCRSGMARRKNCNCSSEQGVNKKEETWLFFQGVDMDAKEKIAKELARLIFGSQDKFVSISLSRFSSTTTTTTSRVDSLEDSRNKRLRDEQSCSYIERFAEAVSSDPHRVIFIEDLEQVDYLSQMGIKKAIERGRILEHSSGDEVGFGDAVIILSCESFSSRSRGCSPSTKLKMDALSQENDQKIEETMTSTTSSPSISLDLNISINDDNDDDNDDDDDEHGDGNGVEGQSSMDEIGLLACVDRCIVFKNHQEL